MKGLSRIDSVRKNMHGWYVRVYGGGKTYSKYFNDRKYGGREASLLKAVDHLMALTREIEKKYPHYAMRGNKVLPFWDRPGKHNSSGVVGVHKTEYFSPTRKRWNKCWVATWNEKGKRKDKAFYYSEGKRTEEEAKRMAIEFRARKMLELGGQSPQELARPKKGKNGGGWIPGLAISEFVTDIGRKEMNYEEKEIRKLEPFSPRHLKSLKNVLGVVSRLFDWAEIDYKFGRGVFKNDIRSRCFWNTDGVRTDVIVEEGGRILVVQGLDADPYYIENRNNGKK